MRRSATGSATGSTRKGESTEPDAQLCEEHGCSSRCWSAASACISSVSYRPAGSLPCFSRLICAPPPLGASGLELSIRFRCWYEHGGEIHD